MSTISERIGHYIERNDISIEELAASAGIDEGRLRAAFAGARPLTPDEYAAVCKGLRVTLDFFSKA